MKNQIQILKERRHAGLADKSEIHKLIYDSYVGGDTYAKGGHLLRNIRENELVYKERCKRAVCWNFTQPIADMLSGFIYANKPEREIPKDAEYLIDKASKHRSFDSFVETVALHSLLYSCGVLVDSPQFDTNIVRTRADEIASKLNPYCVLYYPWQIRDFDLDNDGVLNWVLLDNTYVDSSDPFQEPQTVNLYRLWTRTSFYDIEFDEDSDGGGIISDEQIHGLGVVPFTFVLSRDLDENNVPESIFEDIALTQRSIYNTMSVLDEIIQSSGFQVMIWPVKNAKEIPKKVRKSGAGALTVLPYFAESGAPAFIGTNMSDVSAILQTIEMYVKSILQKVGFDKEAEQNYVQSGIAKNIEFQKTEAFLRLFATQMEEVEKSIIYHARLWRGNSKISIEDTEITYYRKFQSEELENELKRLWELYTVDSVLLKETVLTNIIKKTLPNLEGGDVKKIVKEVLDKLTERQKALDTNINDLADKERQERNLTSGDEQDAHQ